MSSFVAACAWGRDWSSRSRTQGAAFAGCKGKPEDAEMRCARRVIQGCGVANEDIYLGSLDAVARAGLLAVGDACRVEGAAHDLVADARQILDATTPDEHDGVLLQVVALARDVGGDLHPVGQPHTGDLAQGRVRLLRRYGRDAGADAAPLRRGDGLLAALPRLESRGRRLLLRALAALPDKLIRIRHGRA